MDTEQFRILEESLWQAQTRFDRDYLQRTSSVWVRAGSSWQLRFHQGTPAY